ncbi:MAG: hypothetical protein IJI45_00495 [Anaerolineaceae bacterium]|nr:hypothetical protein [Anaerolineaceae bacterium]
MDELKKEYVLNILGAKWSMKLLTAEEYPQLKRADGLTDRSSKTMYVRSDQENEEFPLDQHENYIKEVKRHEIVHAFLYESGLGNDFKHPDYGHDETQVDWIALQFPKMIKAFEAADAL